MTESQTPKLNLLAGVEVLNAVLESHGFRFRLESEGKGSGGHFASGAYYKRDRKLELHFRHSLGLVTYHIGDCSLDHEAYMRMLGVYGQNQYPDFPEEPLESFHHLAEDIQRYCSDFVSGDGERFRVLAEDFRKHPERFKGVP